MLPCFNTGGNGISIEQLGTPLRNKSNPFLMSISSYPSSNPSVYPLPYFNPSVPYQSPSPFSLFSNINNISPLTFTQHLQDPSVPQFITSLDPLKSQPIGTSYPQQSVSPLQIFQQGNQIIHQKLSFYLQKTTFEDIHNFNLAQGQFPQIFLETKIVQSEKDKGQRLGTSSQGQDTQHQKKQITAPSNEDLPHCSTEQNIQIGSEQVLPRSSSDTQAHTNSHERFKLQRTTSDQLINLKRKNNPIDSSKFVDTLTYFKSNPFNQNNNNSTSKACYYRDIIPNDDLPINIFTTFGDSSNQELKFQLNSNLQRPLRCSIFEKSHQKQHHLQHLQSNQTNNKQTNEVNRQIPTILSKAKNLNRHFVTGSSNKNDLLAQLSMEEQSIISAMRESKKFNFSKNVIKQFLKVFCKTSYLYEADSSTNGQYQLNNKPSYENLLEFRKQLSEFLAGCSYKHSAIKRIIQHSYFSLYFKDFLMDHTEEWLAIGKTKYKNEQRIMIQFLQLCAANPKLLVFLSEHEYCSRHN